MSQSKICAYKIIKFFQLANYSGRYMYFSFSYNADIYKMILPPYPPFFRKSIRQQYTDIRE